MAQEWKQVSRRHTRKAHKYTEEATDNLQRRLNCSGLSATMRSAELESLFAEGWEYSGIRKGKPGAPADSASESAEYEFMTTPIKNNAWGDQVVLRRLIER